MSAISFRFGRFVRHPTFQAKLFLFVMFAEGMSFSIVQLPGTDRRRRQFVVGPATKIIKFTGFSQPRGCASSIRGVCNNFQKFFPMLAGAQNFGSDAGNLVSS
jgi:hypothetical protein